MEFELIPQVQHLRGEIDVTSPQQQPVQIIVKLCALAYRRADTDVPASLPIRRSKVPMESALLIKTSLVLFTITALGGVVMAFVRLARNVNPPSWLAMVHGLLAAAGLTLLLYGYFTVGLPTLACWALLLLLVAAAGGALLNLGYQLKAALLPKGIVFVHAGLAVVAYVLLLMTVFAVR